MIRFKNTFLYLWLALPVPLWFTFSVELNAQPIEISPLELSLIIPGGVERDFLVGETISLNLSFRNNAGNPVYVVKPLEGSTNGLRYPHYRIQVKTPVPLYFIPPQFSCGTLNPLHDDDFFRIEAGETRVLSSEETRLIYKPKMAGKHEIVCEIDFNGPWESYAWYYEDSQTLSFKPYWEMIPQVAIQSATVALNVVSNGMTRDPNYHCLMGMPYEEVQRVFQVFPHDTPPNPFGLDDSYYLPYYMFFLNLHFDRDNVVDGVELLNNLSGTSNICLDHLKVLRGGEAVEHESIVYQDDYISAIRVGYFADSSGMNKRIVENYR